MVLMEGFDAYKMYIALKLHFTTKSYNFLDYKGKTRAKRSTFENRNDRYFFKKLSNRKDMQQFLVANFLTGNKWIGNLVNEEEAEKEYFKWKKRIESLSYTFTNDLDKLDLKLKGELTIVISEKVLDNKISQSLNESDKRIISQMINKVSIKEIISLINRNNKISKKEIYDYCLKLKNEV